MNTPDGAISIEIRDKLVKEVNQKIKVLPRKAMEREKFTMFRVPAHIRQRNKELYEPTVVSIGPYYNGKEAFQAMEKHKWRYLQDILSRNSENIIKDCISELQGLESQARRFYFEEEKLQSEQFVMMMLLDGCFILEFLRNWIFLNKGSKDLDLLLCVDWALPHIRSDLLLLENQIPFFVIQKLYDLLSSDFFPAKEDASVNTPSVPTTLVEILWEYLSKDAESSAKTHIKPPRVVVEIKHILHLYYLSYVPPHASNKPPAKTCRMLGWLNPIKLVFFFLTCFLKLCFRRTEPTKEIPQTIPSATALIEAGVIFKCNKKAENKFDIKFQNGTLEIPSFAIEETRRSRLLNLVSFEQQNMRNHKNLTTYVYFMSCLFKTTRDVTLLKEMEIVDNLLANDEELVSFFNWITECCFVHFDQLYLKQLFIDVNEYYHSDWHRWRATLKREYFSNPWLTISFIAAFVLLVLTVVQTVYTLLSYY